MELTAVVVVGWEEEDMAAVERVAAILEEEAKAAGATALVVTALAMAAVVAPEARQRGVPEAEAGDVEGAVTVAEVRGAATWEAVVRVAVAPVEAAWAAADSVAAAWEAVEIAVEAQMAATRSMRSTPAVLRCGPCPWWCACSTRPLEATMQDESMGEGSRRSSLHRGTSGTLCLASWPTPCTQHAWG